MKAGSSGFQSVPGFAALIPPEQAWHPFAMRPVPDRMAGRASGFRSYGPWWPGPIGADGVLRLAVGEGIRALAALCRLRMPRGNTLCMARGGRGRLARMACEGRASFCKFYEKCYNKQK